LALAVITSGTTAFVFLWDWQPASNSTAESKMIFFILTV